MPIDAGNGTGTMGWVRLHRRLATWQFTPVRVTLLYLVFGFTALYVSDVVLLRALDEPLLTQVQAIKGALEVVLTGGLIFLLTRRSRTQLRRTNETLARQREELDVLHRVLRHNLRNALTVIAGRAAQLRGATDLDTEERDHCTRIEETAVRIVEMVEQASRIRRITKDARLVTVDVTETVQSTVDDHPTLPAGVDLRTDLPETAPAVVNHLFEEALGELVSNAVEYNDAERPRLAITVDSSPADSVEVTIADDGPGLDDRVRAVFERGELDQLLHLDGMGLWFVYWTVTDGGGEFAIEDNGWGGTTIRLSLPNAGVEPVDARAVASVSLA